MSVLSWSRQLYYADVLKNLLNITQGVYWPASLALSTGPQQWGLTNTAANPAYATPAPRKMTATGVTRQTVSHTDSKRDAQTGGQTDKQRLPDNCDDVSRNFAGLKRGRPGRGTCYSSGTASFITVSQQNLKNYIYLQDADLKRPPFFEPFFISLHRQKSQAGKT